MQMLLKCDWSVCIQDVIICASIKTLCICNTLERNCSGNPGLFAIAAHWHMQRMRRQRQSSVNAPNAHTMYHNFI